MDFAFSWILCRYRKNENTAEKKKGHKIAGLKFYSGVEISCCILINLGIPRVGYVFHECNVNTTASSHTWKSLSTDRFWKQTDQSITSLNWNEFCCLGFLGTFTFHSCWRKKQLWNHAPWKWRRTARRQYELSIIKMTAWKKANRVALYDTISYPVVIITLLLVGYIMSDCERNSILAKGRISKRWSLNSRD